MKKLIIVLTLILVLSSSVYSQIMVGPKFDFHLSTVAFKSGIYDDPYSFPLENYKKVYKAKFVPGFSVGGVLNYPVTNVFSLEGELFYSRKGKFVDGNYDSKHYAVYHHIDFPLLLRITYRKKTKYNLFFNVGPNVSYWLGGKGTIKSEEFENFGYPEMEYKIVFGKAPSDGKYDKKMYVDKANRFQFGLDFGVGGVFPMNRGAHLITEARFSYGHTHQGKKGSSAGFTTGAPGHSENLLASHRTLSFSVAYVVDVNFKAILKKGKSVSPK